MADDNKQQNPQLQEGETFVPRQGGTAAAVAPAPTTNHSALQSGETFHPRTTSAPSASPAEDTDKTWGSVAGIPYKRSSFDWKHMGQQGLQGLGEMASGLYHTAGDVLNPELTPEQQKKGAFGREASRWGNLADKYIFKPADAENAKAQRGDQSGWESVGHSAAAAVPVLGPWAASLGEQAGTGDVGGALAKGGSQVLAAKLGSKVVPKVANAVLPEINAAEVGRRMVGQGGEEPAVTAPPVVKAPVNMYRGLKYIADTGEALKKTHEGIAEAQKAPKGLPSESVPERTPETNADLLNELKGTMEKHAAAKTIPQPGEIPAKAPSVQDLANQVVEQNMPNAKPLKPNVPLREQMTLSQPEIPGAREIGGATPEDQFQKSFGPEEQHVKGQAEWDTGKPHGDLPEPPSEKLPDQPRTSAHHVYGDEVGEELRDNPELQKYFNGKKGEGFTNVKARQALISAGEDMGQQVVNSKQLQGEGAITPGQAVRLLRSKGYSLKQIRDLAEKNPNPPKPAGK